MPNPERPRTDRVSAFSRTGCQNHHRTLAPAVDASLHDLRAAAHWATAVFASREPESRRIRSPRGLGGRPSSSAQGLGDREGSEHGLGLLEGGVVRGVFDDVRPSVTDAGWLGHGQPGLAVMSPPDKGRGDRDPGASSSGMARHPNCGIMLRRPTLVGESGPSRAHVMSGCRERPELVLQSVHVDEALPEERSRLPVVGLARKLISVSVKSGDGRSRHRPNVSTRTSPRKLFAVSDGERDRRLRRRAGDQLGGPATGRSVR